MITVRELRFGNFISYEGEIERVNIGHLIEAEDDINNIQPIKLTEDWLLKFGFNDTNNGYRTTGSEVIYSITPLNGKPIKLWLDWPSKWVFEGYNECTIMYVHQLQNLYFVLINEELTIKS